MSENLTANQIISRIEDHCGHKIQPRRLRFHLVCEIERRVNEYDDLCGRIKELLDGYHTFDPSRQKAIRLSEKDRPVVTAPAP